MNLTKKKLQDAVEVEGKMYEIHTDHWRWFRFAELIKNDIKEGDLNFLYLDSVPKNEKEGFGALYEFFLEKKEIPRPIESDGTKTLDYTLDADLIWAAVLEQYGIDLCSEPVHWHKVRAMIDGLHGTKMNEIMQIRSWKKGSGKMTDYDRHMMRLKQAWSLPDDSSDVVGESDTLSDADLSILGF